MQDHVVIITINYKQNNYTLLSVKSILENNYKNFHLIIIDNGPADEDHAYLCNEIKKTNDERIQIVRSEKNLGYVGGINFGFDEGMKFHPDYLLIMNNDTILDKNAIEALMNCCKSYNDNAIVTGKVYHYDHPNKLQYIGSKFTNREKLIYEWIGKDEDDCGQYNQVAEREMIDDIFWMVPLKVYNRLGKYSTNFYFNGESSDYCLRALKNDIKLVYTHEAKLWHKGSISIGGRIKSPVTAYWVLQSALVLRYLHIDAKNFNNYYFHTYYEKVIKRFIISLIKLATGKTIDLKILRANLKAFHDFNRWKKDTVNYVWETPVF
jgi:GT2 family glycosyltransferase